MKKLLPWLKSNLISVIAVTIAVIAAPVMLFFSFGWSKSVRKGVENDVSQNLQQLQALDVTYSIRPYLAGQQQIDVKGAPNKASIDAVSALLKAVVDDSGKVRTEAVEFNSAGHELLVSGATPADRLFPDQPDESTRLRLLSTMIQAWPKYHETILRKHRAGTPPLAASVAQSLSEMRSKDIDRLTTGRGESALSAKDAEDLKSKLSDTRLEIYRRAAGETSFYAEPSAFRAVTPWDPLKLLPVETAWEWQFLAWVHSAVIAGVAEANKDPVTGLWQPVYRAPVKIVESVVVLKPGQNPAGSRDSGSSSESAALDGGGGGASTGAQAGPDETADIPLDFKLSHTGRAASPVAPNGMYDIRFIELTVVCASAELPRVLAAFPKVNFMTVVGLKVDSVESLPLLEEGYDVGNEHLVRATLRIESIWLRAWTKQYMPKSVRAALGIPPDPEPAAAGSSGEAAGAAN